MRHPFGYQAEYGQDLIATGWKRAYDWTAHESERNQLSQVQGRVESEEDLMAKSWKCEPCGGDVTELGSYVKLSGQRYRHVSCHDKIVGREAVLSHEREAREREEREAQERREREKAEADRRAEIAERERTNRIRAQQAMPLPPLVQPKAPEPKPEEPKKDRMQLLDLD